MSGLNAFTEKIIAAEVCSWFDADVSGNDRQIRNRFVFRIFSGGKEGISSAQAHLYDEGRGSPCSCIISLVLVYQHQRPLRKAASDPGVASDPKALAQSLTETDTAWRAKGYVNKMNDLTTEGMEFVVETLWKLARSSPTPDGGGGTVDILEEVSFSR